MIAVKPTSILIADDHDIMREGLALLLEDEDNLEIIAVAEDGEDVIEKALTLRPDIILMDVSMPKKNGIEAAKIINEQAPEISIIMLTMHEDRAFLLESLAVGVTGYFLKGEDSKDLVRSLQTIKDGGTYISPKLVGTLVQEYLKCCQRA